MAFPDYPKALNEGLPNGFASSRGGAKVKYVALHVTAGYWDGTISWFNSPQAQANSHYLVGQDGRVCQFVDEDWAAWANFPTNEESVSIEHVDMSKSRPGINNEDPGWMTPAEFEASAQLTSYLLKKYRLGLDAIKRHNEIGNTTHNCPGPNFPMDRYKSRVAEIMRGATTTPAGPPVAAPPSSTKTIYRVVAGQGHDDLVRARAAGFDKAWMMGERVIVGSGTRSFALGIRDRAIRAGFKGAWLLTVDPANPETARPPKGDTVPDWVERPHEYLRACLGGPYVPWVSGPFGRFQPAWVRTVKEGPAPAPEVAKNGAFCAYALTGALLKNGIALPEPLDPEWEGGLLDYGRDWIEEQRIAVVYQPGMEIRKMDAFVVKYTGPALRLQGHTWVSDEDGRNPRVVQWDGMGGGNNRRTLDETIRAFSHGKTVYLIRREKWLKP